MHVRVTRNSLIFEILCGTFQRARCPTLVRLLFRGPLSSVPTCIAVYPSLEAVLTWTTTFFGTLSTVTGTTCPLASHIVFMPVFTATRPVRRETLGTKAAPEVCGHRMGEGGKKKGKTKKLEKKKKKK